MLILQRKNISIPSNVLVNQYFTAVRTQGWERGEGSGGDGREGKWTPPNFYLALTSEHPHYGEGVQ